MQIRGMEWKESAPKLGGESWWKSCDAPPAAGLGQLVGLQMETVGGQRNADKQKIKNKRWCN